ncbi:centromere protein R [Carlito syrichta]|uniref:Centromere protein R n=1 Tax=Carlito syrichta TaxID=1868482 RepID=A0A1U7TQK2_CARSF|nr:centromere protein R [Carlito syrichta]
MPPRDKTPPPPPFLAHARILDRGERVSGGRRAVWRSVRRPRARAFRAAGFPAAVSVLSGSWWLALSRGGGASSKLKMPVRRSLKWSDLLEENSFDPSEIKMKKSIITHSPTTGTCQMSPFASPASSKEQEHRNGPSNGKRKELNHLSLTERKKSRTQDDEFMILLSEVEKSSDEIVKTMQNLRSIQALEGSRELENLIGVSCASRFLKREMQKTKELLTKVTKQKLLEKGSGLLRKESCHLDSYEFLKAISN